MLKQLRENTPPILQLGILLITIIIILVVGIIVWQFLAGQDGEDNEIATNAPISESSLEPSPERTPTEITEASSTPLPTQVVLSPAATATAANTTAPMHTSAATSTMSSVTPTTTATHTSTPTLESLPTQAPIKCVKARNTKDNGFIIREAPDSEIIVGGAATDARLEILIGTVPESEWWYVRLSSGIEGWASLGSLTTGTLIEVLPSCDE